MLKKLLTKNFRFVNITKLSARERASEMDIENGIS